MVTIVSALYNIQRESVDKRKWEDYLQWFEKTLALNCPMVLFVEEDLHDFIMERRSPDNTKVIPMDFKDIPYYFLKEKIDKILASTSYQEIMKDPERIECQSSEYNMVIFSKFPWLERVAKENPFGSDFFLWLDAGGSRFFQNMDVSLPYPSVTGLDFLSKNRGTFAASFNVFSPYRMIVEKGGMPDSYVTDSHSIVHSTYMGGDVVAITQVRKEIDELLTRQWLPQNIINNEQIALGLILNNKPELFTMVNLKKRYHADMIAQFADPHTNIDTSKAKKMTVALIGPGLQPIPPTGWGAVEILVWNLAQTLESMGFSVHIINVQEREQIVVEIDKINPDFVYISYEDFIDIYPLINCPFVMSVHFAYVEQKRKWGIYAHVMKLFTKYSAYVFCLSEGIKKVFLEHGKIPDKKLFMVPNGVDYDSFHFTETPLHPDRSIYLAKIDYRKRQHKFQSINSMYFAGNLSDGRFDEEKNYLGEWKKAYVYENLTHYGNLVLLSDGEAHPLVCMEALAAGLGVVVSEWGAANLDCSQKFITVIREKDINNLALVEEKIVENRQYAIQHRNEIRAYAARFRWDRVVREYFIPAMMAVVEYFPAEQERRRKRYVINNVRMQTLSRIETSKSSFRTRFRMWVRTWSIELGWYHRLRSLLVFSKNIIRKYK